MDTALSPWPQKHHTDHRAADCVCRDCKTNTLHVYVREKEWTVVYREVVDGKESKIDLCAHPLEIEACERNVLSGPECTQHSSIPKSEAPVLVDLMTKLALKLLDELPATVGLGLCSLVFHCVSYDSLFTSLELSVLKPWLVRPVQSGFVQ